MIKQSHISEVALSSVFLPDSLASAETLDADEDLRARDAVVATFEPGIESHETRERLAFLVLERRAADAVGAAGGMDHYVVGGDATGKHVGADADGADHAAADLGRVGDEKRPK